MRIQDCEKERFSSRTIGVMLVMISVLLFTVGLLILPVFGFIFAVPLLILGITMLAAPESRVCRLLRSGLGQSKGGPA